MKKLRKALSLLAALAAFGGGLLTSCSGDDETVIVKPSYEAEPSIIIAGHKADKIALDGTETLEAIVVPEGAKIVWGTSDEEEDFIKIEEDGLSCKVTAVNVCDPDDPDEKVEVWAAFADTPDTKVSVVKYYVVETVSGGGGAGGNGASVYTLNIDKLPTNGKKGVYVAVGDDGIFATDRYTKEPGNATYGEGDDALSFTAFAADSNGVMQVASVSNVNTVCEAIRITVDGSATLTAYIGSRSNGQAFKPELWTESGISVQGADITIDGVPGELGTAEVAAVSNKKPLAKVVITIPSAGTYYFGPTGNKANIYSLELE